MTQLALFDRQGRPTSVSREPLQARADAVATSARNSAGRWQIMAYKAIVAVSEVRPAGFTADDIWEQLERMGESTLDRNPSALGPVILQAARDGLIVKAGRTELSRYTRRHRDLTVWRKADY